MESSSWLQKILQDQIEQIMKPINVEITMGHNIGLSSSYYKPTEKELLEDYLKALDFLTINSDGQKLKKEVETLKESSKNQDYIIKAKLQEKDEQIDALMKKQEKFEQLVQSLIDLGKLKPID